MSALRTTLFHVSRTSPEVRKKLKGAQARVGAALGQEESSPSSHMPQWQFSIRKALPVAFISSAYSVLLSMTPQRSYFAPSKPSASSCRMSPS